MDNPATSRIPPLDIDSIEDEGVQTAIEWANIHSTPRPLWYQTMAHNPELCKMHAQYWRLLFWGGSVPHTTKELVRSLIVELQECTFCTEQQSAHAQQQGLYDNMDVQACTLPDFTHPDPKVQAALRFARDLVLRPRSDEVWDRIYADLLQHYTYGEIVELGMVAANCIGMTPFVHSTALYRLTAKAADNP